MSENRDDTMQANQPVAADDTAPLPAWEEIETGRYQPRRVRGSCHGRELG